MFTKNFKYTSVGAVIMLMSMAMSGTAVYAKGGGGGGGGRAAAGFAPTSGGSGARAGAANAASGRGLFRRDGRRFNNGFGFGGGFGIINQGDDDSVNPAPTGQDLDAYNERQDERRAKLTPSAIVKTYAPQKGEVGTFNR
jgi:hypothetical protein